MCLLFIRCVCNAFYYMKYPIIDDSDSNMCIDLMDISNILYYREKWDSNNARCLYVKYFDPLHMCVQYFNIIHQQELYDQAYEDKYVN